MGCFGKKAEKENQSELEDMDHLKKNEGGIRTKRKFRDVFFLLIFIIFWIGMIIIAGFSFYYGNPTV